MGAVSVDRSSRFSSMSFSSSWAPTLIATSVSRTTELPGSLSPCASRGVYSQGVPSRCISCNEMCNGSLLAPISSISIEMRLIAKSVFIPFFPTKIRSVTFSSSYRSRYSFVLLYTICIYHRSICLHLRFPSDCFCTLSRVSCASISFS